jgi:uncharacterized protein (TIGR02266 family)
MPRTKDRRKEKQDKKNSDQETERRRGDRRSGVRIEVNIWVEEMKGQDTYFQRTGNLSIGGIFFERIIPHPIGTRVRLKFELPDHNGMIDTTGEVVNVAADQEGLGAGIRFIELDAVEKQLIKDFIENQDTKKA